MELIVKNKSIVLFKTLPMVARLQESPSAAEGMQRVQIDAAS